MNCKNCTHNCIKTVPIFENLNQDEIREVEKLIIHLHYPKKQVIFYENEKLDQLLIVRSGKIKLVRYGFDGEEILLDILIKSDIYGGDFIFSNSITRENVITLEDTDVCIIKVADLTSLILKKPTIALKIIEQQSLIVRNYRAILEIISIKDTNKRIASFLLERSRRLDSNIITITQEDIGNSINLTKETVNRKLSLFQNKNLIRIEGQKQILILDKNGLENL